MDAICAHLEAVTAGKINRLLINVPPGCSKSLLVSVFWQAWEWGPCGLRSMRYLTTAYNEDPVIRDNCKTRDLIMSEWYQQRWPVELTRTGATSFANVFTGSRFSCPFGSLTSQRGDRLIIDDPHSVKTAESDADRRKTGFLFRTGAINRLNDQMRSAIVIIMQRLHEEDISGLIIALKMGYVHLRLPMEFEADHRCETKIGFIDPRIEDGELLDPTRFPPEIVSQLHKDMGSIDYAGQYQQRPAPRGGALFKYAWFENKFVDNSFDVMKTVRHWDLAATRDDHAARSAGVKISKTRDGRYIVENVIIAQEEGPFVRKLIRAVAEKDGVRVHISLPQDPGQSGKVQAQDLVAMLAGYQVHVEKETGDKEVRSRPFAAQCEAGNVYIVRGEWNELFLDELTHFPQGKWKDQVDGCSGAFACLNSTGTDATITRELVRELSSIGRR